MQEIRNGGGFGMLLRSLTRVTIDSELNDHGAICCSEQFALHKPFFLVPS